MSKANGPAGRVPPARRRVGPGLAPAFWRFPAFLGLQTRRPNLSLLVTRASLRAVSQPPFPQRRRSHGVRRHPV